jgi:hypothetical protein
MLGKSVIRVWIILRFLLLFLTTFNKIQDYNLDVATAPSLQTLSHLSVILTFEATDPELV